MPSRFPLFATLSVAGLCALARADGLSGAAQYHAQIQPLLQTYCYDCHADGVNKGNIALDGFKSDQAVLTNRDLWEKALHYVRAGLMPPAKKPHPTLDERGRLTAWIKTAVFQSDPLNPDPGEVVLRRLNRAEYRNTIRDLMGVDYDTEDNFPPDDTGFGFDTIGGVLTISPMLFEKYLTAAQEIVAETVPDAPRVVAEKPLEGWQFRGGGVDGSTLSYYAPAAVSNQFNAPADGHYQLVLDLKVNEKFVDGVFDYNRCRLTLKIDGQEAWHKEYSWEGGKPYHYELKRDWAAGIHRLEFDLAPLTPGKDPARTLSIQVQSLTVQGPMDGKFWVKPKNYDRFFPGGVPAGRGPRRRYAEQLLGNFAARAFRRPVDDRTVRRLADLAEEGYSQPGKTFEEGVGQAMVAVLTSPRFLFLQESPEVDSGRHGYPYVDEYALASRLSYFLWSSMPDEELRRLAGEGALRQNLRAQVQRMLKDDRSQNFVRDFAGQWLRARDIESIQIESREVLSREHKPDPQVTRDRNRFYELAAIPKDSLTPAQHDELKTLREKFFKRSKAGGRRELNYEVRHAMREETEDVFSYVLHQDRSLLELLDSDYTYLNDRLARFYGLTNLAGLGHEMHRVQLPAGSQRGGILTEGTVLVATSNPTRTSPVKRGLFILDSVLGTPPPPPPPNIPPLEDAAKGIANHTPTLRETLAIHRQNPLCSSCHSRMDPLGLAFENFNAMGLWRTNEFGNPIDTSGRLITGEAFKDVRDLKHILVEKHAEDFYRTLTEKMLTYAIGRGLEYYDVESVDQIVARIEQDGGRSSALISGIIDSAPFQKCRGTAPSMSAQLSSSQAVRISNNP